MKPDKHESDLPVAVIDVGSSAIRLAIAEIQANGTARVLENASRPVTLGRDVFFGGKISPSTIKQAVEIIRGYQDLMKAYGVGMLQAVGTSALREAQNRETFLDRVRLRTGVDIRVIDGIEANHFTYVAIREALANTDLDLASRSALIVEVGGGSTDVMVFQKGELVAAHTLAIGSQRTGGEVTRSVSSAGQRRAYLEEKVETALGLLRAETTISGLHLILAVGGDMRIAGRHAGRVVDDAYYLVDRESFEQFVSSLMDLSEDEIVELLRIPYSDAETLVFGLVIYGAFLAATAAEEIVVPFVSIRDGVLCTIASATVEGGETEYHRQVVSSALNLIRKYHADESHALHVTDLALRLFDFMTSEHGLESRQRLLLQVAGILHDIGTFINFSSHHKHGQYIILASDIFGLDRRELLIVSNVVRYHRRAMPQPSHRHYASQNSEDRIIVSKLAALLRLADALDRGHQQRIKEVDMELVNDELILRVRNAGDVSIERFGIGSKAQLLEEVYGYKTVLLA